MTKSLTFAIVTTFALIFRNFSVRYKCQSADQFVVIILLILQERKVWLFSVPAKIYDDSILVTKTPLDYIHHEQRGFIWLEFMRQFSRVGFHTTCQITPSLIQLFFFWADMLTSWHFPFASQASPSLHIHVLLYLLQYQTDSDTHKGHFLILRNAIRMRALYRN